MNKLVKPALVLGFVGAVALAAVTPSEARSGRNALAIGAGIAGLAVGAAVASSAANNYYYDGYYGGPYYRAPAYGYYQEPYVAYDSYAYSPGYRRYNPDPSSYYAPTAPTYYYQYENSRERQLRGGDY